MKMAMLTNRQKEYIKAVKRLTIQLKRSPSLSEISGELGVSRQTVSDTLQLLHDKGAIKLSSQPRKRQTIEVMK